MGKFYWLLFLISLICVSVADCQPHRSGETGSGPEQCPSRKFGNDCQFDCRCRLSTDCGRLDGSCFYGCNSPFFGPGCQYRVLGGSARQSSTISRRRERICPPNSYCRYAYVTYDAAQALTGSNGICARIYSGSERYWLMDTSDDHLITGMEFTSNRAVDVYMGPSSSLTGTGNTLCKSVRHTYNTNLHNITCTNPVRAQYVIVKFKPSYGSYVELCKVKVRGSAYQGYCSGGRYGPACIYKCRCMLMNEQCHMDGSCPSGCNQEFVGQACDIRFQTNATIGVEKKRGSQDVAVVIPRWTHKHNSGRGEFQVQYMIELYSKGVWRELSKLPFVTAFTLIELTPYTQYSMRVTLGRITTAGTLVRGPPGKLTNFTTTCAAPSEAPRIVKVESSANRKTNDNMAIVTWKPIPADKINCESLEKLVLSYRPAFSSEWSVRYCKAEQTSVALTGLRPNTVYEYRMTAVNSPGLTVLGDVVASKTLDGVLPAVRIRDIKTLNDSSIQLRWSPPLTTTTGTLLGYEIRITELAMLGCAIVHEQGRTVRLAASSTMANMTKTFSDLKAHRKYNFTICAYTSAGCGEEERFIIGVTASRVPTDTPTRALVSSILPHSARLKLFTFPCHSRDGYFRGFSVLISNSTSNRTLTSQFPVFDVDGLAHNCRYRLQYAWTNTAGSSPLSPPVVFTTHNVVPGGVVIVNHVTTPRIISLVWRSPGSTYGQIVRYEAMCTLPAVRTVTANITTTTLESEEMIYFTFDAGMMPKRRYNCKVRGYNIIGAGEWSNVSIITTNYRNTLPVSDLTVNQTSGTVFGWVEPRLTHGILGYKLQCRQANVAITESSTGATPEMSAARNGSESAALHSQIARLLLEENIFRGDNEYKTDRTLGAGSVCDVTTILPSGNGATSNSVTIL